MTDPIADNLRKLADKIDSGEVLNCNIVMLPTLAFGVEGNWRTAKSTGEHKWIITFEVKNAH